MILIAVILLMILLNIVWQVHIFIVLAKTSEKVVVENQEEEKITTISVRVAPVKEEHYQKSIINKFEVNNWRKMHGLIKKSKKKWQKKGKLYGAKSDRR